MDLYESDYWKLTIFLQKFVGLWVFRKKQWMNYVSWIYVYGFTTSFVTAMAIRWFNELGINTDIVIENAIGELYLSLILIKLSSTISSKRKLQKLYKDVANDWKIITVPEELKVMHNYTAIGARIVKIYSTYMLIGVTLFLAMPVFSPLLDYVIPLENATRPKALPYYAEYGIDIEKHFYPMVCQALFGGIGTITVLVSFDLGFILIVQHVVALFELVNFRLTKAAEIADTMAITSKNNSVKDDIARHHIVSAIELHQKAVQYVDTVEDCFSLTWLFVLFINMIMVGGGMSICLMKINRPEESLRYVTVTYAAFIHFYYIFLPGQKIINSSTDVFDYCYACSWYNLSKKTKSLIQIMMLRSYKRCELTGGKMFPLSMDTYCRMMKTGFSIFTVLNT